MSLAAVAWHFNAEKEPTTRGAGQRLQVGSSPNAAQVARLPQRPARADHVQQALAQAEPLLSMIRSGMLVSDEEIFDADVGVVEPLLLAQAAHNRDVVALAVAQEEEIAGPDPEQLLTPTALAWAGQRSLIRTKMLQRMHAAAQYRSDLHAAGDRGRLRLLSALAQMPSNHFGAAVGEFDSAMAPLLAYADGLDETTRETGRAIVAILDLLEKNPSVRVIDTGQRLQLEFANRSAAVQYQRHLGAVARAVTRQRDNEARFVRAPVLTSG